MALKKFMSMVIISFKYPVLKLFGEISSLQPFEKTRLVKNLPAYMFVLPRTVYFLSVHLFYVCDVVLCSTLYVVMDFSSF